MSGSPSAVGSRVRVLYSGDVQGVGFRHTAARTAEGRGVSGFVRNLADGRVELVAEGRHEELERFLESLGRRMETHIRASDALWTQDPEGLSGFEVRR